MFQWPLALVGHMTPDRNIWWDWGLFKFTLYIYYLYLCVHSFVASVYTQGVQPGIWCSGWRQTCRQNHFSQRGYSESLFMTMNKGPWFKSLLRHSFWLRELCRNTSGALLKCLWARAQSACQGQQKHLLWVDEVCIKYANRVGIYWISCKAFYICTPYILWKAYNGLKICTLNSFKNPPVHKGWYYIGNISVVIKHVSPCWRTGTSEGTSHHRRMLECLPLSSSSYLLQILNGWIIVGGFL